MNAVGEVNRCRSCRKILDITGRGKTVHAVREQVQIILKQIHELLVV